MLTVAQRHPNPLMIPFFLFHFTAININPITNNSDPTARTIINVSLLSKSDGTIFACVFVLFQKNV
jgi:hypothetical protein